MRRCNVHRYRVGHTGISMYVSRAEERATIAGIVQGHCWHAVSFDIRAWLVMEWHVPDVCDGKYTHDDHEDYIKSKTMKINYS